MRRVILQWGLFDPTITKDPKWSELILLPLLEMMAFANAVYLRERPWMPRLYDLAKLPRYKGQSIPLIQYIREPPGEELLNGWRQVLRDGGGDCFPEGTVMLRRGMELSHVEDLNVGERIWGYEDWTVVEAKEFKGRLPVDVLHLNNGSDIPLTGDHHVYVLECLAHGTESRSNGKYGCSCPPSRRRMQRVRVSELRAYMVLAQPERLPFGDHMPDPDRTYVDGLYISDGWSDQPSRFSISGQDGGPKEVQKREVKRICARFGIPTRWNRKYIAVNDGTWALHMQLMGARAPEKHALDLNLGEAAAAALLRGIMADSGKNTNGPGRTFTTTSKLLATQVRLLHKMFGRTASYRYVPDHGGLGMNPVHRLGVRAFGHEKLLRIRSITRRAFVLPCWDIQTSDHRVYLPEHDVTVSQCDDLTAMLIADLRERGSPYYPRGEPANFRILKFTPPGRPLLYHIQVWRPPQNPAAGRLYEAAMRHPAPALRLAARQQWDALLKSHKGWVVDDPSAKLGMPVTPEIAQSMERAA